MHIPIPCKLTHLMKEVSCGVCVSSLLCGPSWLPLSPLLVGSLPEGITKWESPASSLGQCFCGNLSSFGMVLFLCCIFSFVPALFQQTSLCRKSSLGDSIGCGPCGRNLSSVTDPCGMLCMVWWWLLYLHVSITVGLNPSQSSR